MKTISLLSTALIICIALISNAQFKVLSGLEGGTYNEFANDIKSISSQEIEVLTSGGSIENFEKLMGKNDIDITFLQYDVLLEKEKANPELKNKVKIFLPILFLEEIHCITKADAGINTINDLAGKKVAIGAWTQGTNTTAKAIKEATGIQWEDVETHSNEAIQALFDGKIDAFFYVGGAPISKLAKLDSTKRSQLKMVNLKNKKIPITYIKQKMKADTYDFLKEDIDIYSVVTLLVVKIYQGEISDNVEKLYADIDAKIRKLMENGHPKWADAYETYRRAMINWPLYISDPGE